MKLSDFDYLLPPELIAQYPLKMREGARLLAVDRLKGKLDHAFFSNITGYLKEGDCLVLNDSRVLPARISAQRATGGKVEILLLSCKGGGRFSALLRPARLKLGERINFEGNGTCCEISGKNEVTFSTADTNKIYSLGKMPLPPYIKREPDKDDAVYYQTVYAKYDGSIASPTAGLHFTPELLKKISSQGVKIAYVTLHVGYGTFKPVKSESVTAHKMEPEHFSISDEAIRNIEEARLKKRSVFAVGTTSCRALETYAATGLKEADTDLFIYPGYDFKMVDALITNFHLPRTTLFMLTCAFCATGASASGGGDYGLMKEAYHEAVEKKYRFYSYGDAMLIL